MADFLTHLIARSFEQGPRLQRRVPSLFEPPQGAAAWPEPAAAEAEVERGPSAAQDAPPRTGDARPVPAPATPAEEPPARGVAPTPRTELRVQPIAVEASRAAVRPADAVPSAPSRRDGVEPHAAQEAGARGPLRRSGHEDHEEPGAAAIAERTPERTDVRETRVDRTVLVPPAAGRAPRAAIGATPRGSRGADERRSAREPLAGEAPPQPTISVTIGRVEVRASQAPESPRARRDATPRLKLDDYLRRRSGRDE